MNEHSATYSAEITPAQGVCGLSRRACKGFTLVEVVLAVGVLSLAIVALLGLFGPTMGAVKNVVDRSGATMVADQLNAALLSNQIYSIDSDINTFDKLAGQVGGGNLWLYAWRQRGATSSLSQLEVQFSETKPADSVVPNIEGALFYISLKPATGLTGWSASSYSNVGDSAYFPILVSIYEVPLMGTGVVNEDGKPTSKPLFQYTTAKLR